MILSCQRVVLSLRGVHIIKLNEHLKDFLCRVVVLQLDGDCDIRRMAQLTRRFFRPKSEQCSKHNTTKE